VIWHALDRHDLAKNIKLSKSYPKVTKTQAGQVTPKLAVFHAQVITQDQCTARVMFADCSWVAFRSL